MPPRKSDALKAATGDEGTPVKDMPPREGINVEVTYPVSLSFSRTGDI
jgi:hypothetical protein